MGIIKGVVALGFSMFSIIGCSSIMVSGADGKTVKYQNLQLSESAKTVLNTGNLPENMGKIYPDAIFIFNAYKSPEKIRAREIQIATLSGLIFNSDSMCEEYMVKILNRTKGTSSAFDVSSLLFSSWASVTDVQTDAKVLASLSSFASGSRSRLTENVLNKSTPDLIYSATMAYRDKERASLITMLGLAAKDDTISIAPIAAKINSYHNACGITIGINQLTASVNDKAKNAEEDGTNLGNKLMQKLK